MILDGNSPLFGAQVRILESSKSVLSETPSFAHKSFVQWKGASEENPCLTPFLMFFLLSHIATMVKHTMSKIVAHVR